MLIESIWEPDKKEEVLKVYATEDSMHPAVQYIFNISNKINIGGKLKKINLPKHYDFTDYRLSPKIVKQNLKKWDGIKLLLFKQGIPLHRAHVEMTFRSIKKLQAGLLLHPVVGPTKSGDVNHYTRVKCYEHVLKKYPNKTAMLSLLPLAMRMGGPKEALLHALIRKIMDALILL